MAPMATSRSSLSRLSALSACHFKSNNIGSNDSSDSDTVSKSRDLDGLPEDETRSMDQPRLRVRNQKISPSPSFSPVMESNSRAEAKDLDTAMLASSNSLPRTPSNNLGPMLGVTPVGTSVPLIKSATGKRFRNRGARVSECAGDTLKKEKMSQRLLKTGQPLKNWMSQLHHKRIPKHQYLKERKERWLLSSSDDSDSKETKLEIIGHSQRHRKSSSWSSSAFVTAVKSSNISLDSFPTLQRHRSHGSGSMVAIEKARGSTEHSSEGSTCSNQAAATRALLRQLTLYELMSTEANYIEDVRALISTYRLIEDLMPGTQKVEIHESIFGILDLHEELLDQLRELGVGPLKKRPSKLHKRLSKILTRHPQRSNSSHRHSRSKSSSDTFPTCSNDAINASCGISPPSPEPTCKDVAHVAHIFGEMLIRFFVYEEYAAAYTGMLGYLTTSTGNIPHWQSYERGLERLVNTMAPLTQENKIKNKSLTFGDLLIKPIQRVCKYPLLFADLLMNTPVIDCPESHAAVEKTLFRLRETAEEINQATSDEYMREKIERSWKLQDLLRFPKTMPVPFPLRLLGRAELCGTLFVVYQLPSHISGKYMLCALFKSYLLLANPIWGPKGVSYFSIAACVSLCDLKVEPPENGQGIQCYSAPFAWKITFEADQNLLELLLYAYSETEERIWRSQITTLAAKKTEKMHIDEMQHGSEQLSFMTLKILPLGNAFLARRLSMRQVATLGANRGLKHVLVKNTCPSKMVLDDKIPAASIKRSQSLQSSSCSVTVLCPQRNVRIGIEEAMCMVWSREFLPYPAMSEPHERSIRRSASQLMRKLGKNSLTSNMSRQSPQHHGPSVDHQPDLTSGEDKPDDPDRAALGTQLHGKQAQSKIQVHTEERRDSVGNASGSYFGERLPNAQRRRSECRSRSLGWSGVSSSTFNHNQSGDKSSHKLKHMVARG